MRLIALACGLSALALPAGSCEESPRRAPAPATLAYVLQAEGLAPERADAVARLAASGRDWVVLDPSFDGDEKWTEGDLAAIRAGREGRRILAYLSIGEAEDYRPYWRSEWDADRDGRPDEGAADFLLPVNPRWPGNYPVKYWKPAWQALIFDALDSIVAGGFDGVYLDIVDGFEAFEHDAAKKRWIADRKNPETGRSYREDMDAWVQALAARARAKAPNFLVVPQNGAALLARPDYARTVDAIGIEDLFTEGNKAQAAADTAERLGQLRPAVASGLPVLLIEYATEARWRKVASAGAAKEGLRLLFADRELKTLGEVP